MINSGQRISLQIVGLITSVAYQKAIYYLQICSRLPHVYSQPVARGLPEFEWNEYLVKQRRKFGGRLWALRRPVAVYCDKKFIGGDRELLKHIDSKFLYSAIVPDSYFQDECVLDFERYVLSTKRIFVYFIVRIKHGMKGALIFKLYSDLLPDTCEIFKNFCASKAYKSTRFHRVCKRGWIQGGAAEDGREVCEQCKSFPDESFCINHNRRGVLSMVNDGRHTNCKQFFVTLNPSCWMDYRYVAFGQLVAGADLLAAIESVDTYYEKPLSAVRIADCGVLHPRHVLTPRQTAEAIIDLTLQAVVSRTDSVTFERGLEGNVTDPRDVDSRLSATLYNQGMYSI
ncbi:probable inactive peptidyl-prolyl cis-trans isomerase-like 6 [Bacillus rossius redtenbacheri]|uniref:probable inactive peptidyl-prolyl cis-trans isomerase-like 6 n=1 Tax=Bacillus rossius redtenbacheri TaxID=93214 RepID=UPI002FDE92FB